MEFPISITVPSTHLPYHLRVRVVIFKLTLASQISWNAGILFRGTLTSHSYSSIGLTYALADSAAALSTASDGYHSCG